MRLTATVIGLGKIGLGYDYHLDNAKCILTHCAGFAEHKNYQLMAAVDPDYEKRQLFTKKYHAPAYETVKEMLTHHHPDVISLAVPTDYHYSSFCDAIIAKPKAIICEKPIAPSLKEAQAMFEMAKQNNCSLLVNYIRRFDSGVISLRKAIHNHAIGDVYKIIVTYSNGILNNGSHYIDLLQFLFGNISQIKIIKKGSLHLLDPEPDVYCQIGSKDVYFLASRNEYETFVYHDITFIGTEGIIKYQNGGEVIIQQNKTVDKVFSSVSTLSDEIQLIPNEMYKYQWHVCDHLYRHLSDGHELNSNGQTALETLSVVENIMNRIKEDEKQACIA